MLPRWWIFLAAAPLFAQPACPGATAWSSCDFAFDLEANEDAAKAELHAEFRSPHHRTYMMQAFRDGDRRLTIRFSPTEGGPWTYKISSNLPRLDGKEVSFSAADSESPGFVRVANVHHFAWEGTSKAHLWMATAIDRFTTMPRAEFDRQLDQRVKEKFTHLRVTIEPSADLREAADRIRAINQKGLVADLLLAAIPEDWKQRELYITDIAARFSGMNITWMGVPSFENARARVALKDTGALLKKLDAYDHPRTTLAASTSAPLLGDAWMSLIDYGTPDPNIGAVEHQLYQVPAINTAIQNVNDLWTATMNGQYPAAGSGEYMTAWFDFMSGNRYWDLEPYFDLDGGRALALDGVEYIVYIEKPGPVEVTVEKHGYDVAWIDPMTGERTKEKGYNGEHYTGEPPDKSHPWVLHISREGTKEGMLRSWKFESRPVPVQEVEQDPAKIPFEVDSPKEGEISVSRAPFFSLKVKRQTRGTRSLLIEWMGDVPIDGEGYRVVGTGREGTMQIPKSIAKNYPAVMSLRVGVLNANGKAYIIDKVFRLVP
ncbi:MAG: DUF5060 domain-containing protein [Acidobacteriia bacterium]|nr:DUF5060 domain-containing protein [Terriglobia bacterium]